jgi:hypothetical protein
LSARLDCKRMLRSIKQQVGNVILRAEVAGMGRASQVTEALKSLQEMGVLVRIGTGVYAKARRSSVTGAVIPAGSLETLAVEALKKLGVSGLPGSAATAYNSGRTTQWTPPASLDNFQLPFRSCSKSIGLSWSR